LQVFVINPQDKRFILSLKTEPLYPLRQKA
jgi:hypothetical protein